MEKSRKNYIQSCAVSEVRSINLGGYVQKVAIEGKSKNLPIVVCLHGGPGTPIPFSVGSRGMFPEWTDRAIMVYWDQLGCGANNHKIDDSFTVDSFVKMTRDLLSMLKENFPQNKIYIFGVSWGSILAIKAAVNYPKFVDGVVIYGQTVKNLMFNDCVFESLSAASKKAAKRIEKIKACGKHCDGVTLVKNLGELSGYIKKYTDGYINRSAQSVPLGKILKGLKCSPDYSLGDFKAIFNNGYRGNVSLWRELVALDLSSDFEKVSVPYVIIQGDTDIVTPTPIVKTVVDSCGNKNVSLHVVPTAGHVPPVSAMKEVFVRLCNLFDGEI